MVLQGATEMDWVWSRVKALWIVLHSPGEAFACGKAGPSYLVPFVVLSSLYLLLSVIQAPIQEAWIQEQMTAAGTPPAQVAAGLDLLRRSSRFAVVSVPFLLLLRWLAHALLVWLVAQALLVGLDFSKTLTTVAYAYVPVLLRDATACLILCLRPRELLTQPGGLNVALGLNLLFPQIPPPWWSLAANVNLFEVWFIALLAAGVSAFAHVRRRQSLLVVLPVWLFVTLAQFGFTALGQRLQGQLTRG